MYSLTIEELFLLMNIFDKGQFPGLDRDPFENMQDSEREIKLNECVEFLCEKGFLTKNSSGEFDVDMKFGEAFIISALPHIQLSIIKKSEEQENWDDYYSINNEGCTYIHKNNNVFTITRFENTDLFEEHLVESLKLVEMPKEINGYTIVFNSNKLDSILRHY